MNNNAAKISWKKAVLLLLGVGLLSAGLSIFFQVRGQAIPQSDPQSAAASSVLGDGSSFKIPGKPVRLVIPAIGVDAAIQSVGLFWSGNGEMGIPTNFTDVAWYNGGPRPGMPGSAVIDGHLDGRFVKKAVFYNLGDLKPGDLVKVIDASGTALQFQVVRLATFDYNATTTDVFSGEASKARLNLITCAGSWVKTQRLYDKRIVVYTELVTHS